MGKFFIILKPLKTSVKTFETFGSKMHGEMKKK